MGDWGQQMSVIISEWMNNQVLLYSTENYIQYSMINHNGKEYIKKNVYITESFYGIAKINTTL